MLVVAALCERQIFPLFVVVQRSRISARFKMDGAKLMLILTLGVR